MLCCRGTLTSLLVRLSLDRALRVRALAGDILLCSWERRLTVTVPLSTQVYKWVPVNLILGVTLRWTSIPSRGDATEARDKRWPDGPLARMHWDFTLTQWTWPQCLILSTVDLVTLTNVVSALDQHNLKNASNDVLIGVPEMVKVLTTIYENIEVPADYTMISNEFCVDLTLNWLLNVYDRYEVKTGVNVNASLVYWIREDEIAALNDTVRKFIKCEVPRKSVQHLGLQWASLLGMSCKFYPSKLREEK